MSFAKSIAADPLTWRPAVLVRQKDGWMLEEKALPEHALAGSDTPDVLSTDAVKQTGTTSQIMEVLTEYDRVLNKGDAQRLAELFTTDAVMLPPSEPPVRGRDHIRARHGGLFREFRLKHRLNAADVIVTQGWAFATGTYEMELQPRTEGKTSRRDGHFLTILNRGPSGSWQIARDTWN